MSFETNFDHPMRLGFRLDSFAVYASLISLPPSAQDSLYSGIGSPSVMGLSPIRFARLRLGARVITLFLNK
jgi:hypothetical protein